MLLVVTQRTGAGSGLFREFTDAHAATVNLDTDVNASPIHSPIEGPAPRR
jgi:hypothetical protein